MLSTQDSIEVVVNCIRSVSGARTVDINGTLHDAQLIDEDRVGSMLTRLIWNDQIGVPSKRPHVIDHDWFRGTNPKTKVMVCIGIVRAKAYIPRPAGNRYIWKSANLEFVEAAGIDGGADDDATSEAKEREYFKSLVLSEDADGGELIPDAENVDSLLSRIKWGVW